MRYRLGIIIPIYGSTRSVPELLAQLKGAGLPAPFHIYLVDDSGEDAHFRWLAAHCAGAGITLLRLAKNSGQQNALLCGMRAAICECEVIATMDDDLQHPAALLPQMCAKLQEGYSLVYAVAKREKRPLYRRIGSLCRDGLFALLFAVPKGVHVSSYRVMTNALAVQSAQHDYRFYYMTASALCTHTAIANIAYPENARAYGKSGYSLAKLFRLYFGIIATYTKAGRLLLRPKKGTGYELQESIEEAAC